VLGDDGVGSLYHCGGKTHRQEYLCYWDNLICALGIFVLGDLLAK